MTASNPFKRVIRQYLYAGTQKIKIEGTAAVDVEVQCHGQKRRITLENTLLTSSFHISVVSLDRFTAKDVHLNTEERIDVQGL